MFEKYIPKMFTFLSGGEWKSGYAMKLYKYFTLHQMLRYDMLSSKCSMKFFNRMVFYAGTYFTIRQTDYALCSPYPFFKKTFF